MEDGHEGEPQATRARILVVDDYAPNLIALRALLEPIAAVTGVDSGARALEESAQCEFAVVVLDVNMPCVDGLEVARRIRAGQVNAQVPIIFLTSMDSDTSQILDGYAAGAVDYLRRPFSQEILRSKVAVFVELHERREQAKREAAERARLEAERVAAEQASRDKDRFLAVLSHELRTPLTSILLWSDMLLRRELPAETLRRGLETIDLCARYESHIVERVLEMSRLVTGTMSLELTAVDVNEVVTEAAEDVARLAAERRVQVAVAAERVCWRAVGDRLRLRQVVYNLLENAVNFTPAGGRVDLTLEDDSSAVQIQVRDTGIGFAADFVPNLFARFKPRGASAKRAGVGGGLGLGLALAKELVELHGGQITGASAGPGLGAAFTVTLPHTRASA
jgi:two-component system, sensor histidine kinase